MNTESNQQLAEIEREVEQQPMALATAIMRAEIDEQMTTARAFPRSVKRFISKCTDLATLNEDVAESCMYALPRGGKTIEGPSARFAELLQSAWGNCRGGARVVDEGNEFVTAQGVFHDLESNSMVTMEVKRRITNSKGERFNTDMVGVTGNAAASIAHRNAVLKGVPKALWDPIYRAARKCAVGDIKSLANKRAEALEWLQKHHVSNDMVFATLGVDGIEDVGLDQLAILKGSIAAVKNGELTIEAAFAPRETTAPKGKPKTDAPKTKASGASKGKTAATAVDQLADVQLDLKGLIDKSGVPESEVLARYEVGTIEELTQAQCVLAMTWIKKAMAG